MTRILTQAEIDLCDQFEAFMASLIEGPVTSVSIQAYRNHFGANAHDEFAAYGGDYEDGRTVAARLQSALGQVIAAEANKAETLKERIAAMQAQLQELAV